MRDFTLDHCVKAAARLVESGYTQVKTQLALPGRSSVGKEIERVREIRNAIGPDVDLMADVNQRWDVRQALSIGSRIEEFGLYWLEDPVAHDDYPGLAAVADGLKTPIAAGEYVYGSVPFRHMLEARSVDIVMADVMRTGGITHWLKIAGMAEAFNLPIVSHLYPELSVHLVCAVPNGLVIENMPWSNRLFQEVPAAGRRRARRAAETRPRSRVRRAGLRALRRLTRAERPGRPSARSSAELRASTSRRNRVSSATRMSS